MKVLFAADGPRPTGRRWPVDRVKLRKLNGRRTSFVRQGADSGDRDRPSITAGPVMTLCLAVRDLREAHNCGIANMEGRVAGCDGRLPWVSNQQLVGKANSQASKRERPEPHDGPAGGLDRIRGARGFMAGGV